MKTIEKQLAKQMLKYYERQNFLGEERDIEVEDYEKNREVFLKLDEKKTIFELTAILKDQFDNSDEVFCSRIADNLKVQEWFINKSIILDSVFDRNSSLDVLLKWERINNKLSQSISEWEIEFQKKERLEHIELILKECEKEKLFGVSEAQIKNFCHALGIPFKNRVQELVVGVQKEIYKRYPDMIPRVNFKRKPFSKAVRIETIKRDCYECQFCGSKDRLEVDHIIPVSRGGNDEMSNLITLCKACNIAKGTRILDIRTKIFKD